MPLVSNKYVSIPRTFSLLALKANDKRVHALILQENSMKTIN